nr:Zn-binding domain-containing protein [Jiangella gansuensis]
MAGYDAGLYQPAIYCRNCGRSGWGSLRSVTGSNLDTDAKSARQATLTGNDRYRALIFAGGEAAAVDQSGGSVTVDGLYWLDLRSREVLAESPSDDDEELRHVPVLTDWDGRFRPRDEVCPSCQQKDSIRFLGTRSSTLASVSLNALFGSESLESAEKKTLLFTDSVQDAAYTAGFVQARSHTMSRRSVVRSALSSDPMPLPDVAADMMAAAGEDPHARYALIPPELADRKRFARYWTMEGDRREERAARHAVKARLDFDLALEFGLQSRTGRTLELTGSAVAEVDVGTSDRLRRAAAEALSKAREQHSFSPEFDELLGVGIDATLVSGWARGVLERMRVQGGVHHPWLDAYLRSDGNRWFLLGGRRRRDRDDGMPAFPRGRPSPAFPTTSAARESLDSVTGHASWYARWAVRQLGTTPRDGGVITGAFLARAAQEGWLTETATDSGARVYRIPPDLVVVHIPGDGALADGEHALRCYVCHTVTPGSQATITDLDGAACLRQGCPGRLHRHALAADYYRELYDSSRIRRVVAREHTSLLPDKVRLEHEEAFKSGRGPNVPNVLAATPTLELGIDIGDLSTVMLGSLPREVASYQQRVGRAGRLTGNALVLGYVRGRGQNLQRLNEPTSLIDGEIRPPATYLDAIEILQRQYVAFLIDQRVRSGVPDPPSGRGATRQVLASGWDTGTWIGDLLSDARIKANEYTSRFLGLFGNLVAPDTAATLRAWAGVELPDNEVSGVEHIFQSAIRSYQHELDDLGRRSGALADSLPELIQAAERATATDEDQRNRRAAEAEQRALDMRRAALRGQYWINALEERGVLPNYTLLDDTVQLDVSLRWYDHDTGDFHHEPQTYQRGASVALTDFAPGATFYAQSVAIAIDAVDVGPGLDMVRERWIVCARCGWSVAEQATVGPPSQACPRCGDAAVRDVGQRLDVIPLERVSAEVFRDEALISDGNDDRVQTSFSVVPLVDVDPARVSGAWRLDGYPFGAEYVRECLVRWVNLGLAQRSGSERVLAGNEIRAPLFRVCPACGVVPSAQRRDENEARHRGWCPHRRDLDIDWQTVALGRSLRTQAVQLLIPPHFTRDTFAGASFRAALLLGLREVIGGAPDHLDVVEAHAPVDGQDRIVLVLHDTVPGGTGYLADFARPSRVHDVLSAALDVLSTCSCREEQVLACHRCLMPFAPPQMVEHTSRARAEQLLREILDSGRENAGASDDSPWSVTEISSLTDVVLESTESHLEQRFRATLVDALRARGADIREEPHVDGTVVHIGVPGDMRRQWALRPQPRLHGTRPDFVLMTEDTSVPAMYIYTDGRRFHSHPRANNLADDAEKRAILRQAGHVVWAVTTADLDAFEARTEGAAVPPPTWFTDHVRTNLARLRGRELVSAGSVGDDVITADAVTQILTWVANPEPARWRSLASILPLAFMDQNRREWNLERLPGVVLAALAGAPAPPTDPGGLAGWWWQDSTCVIAAATPAPPALDITTILAVDDTSAALEADESGAAWRTWLALSNILGFAARPPLITTQSLLAGPAVSHPPRAVDYTFTPPDDTVAVVSPAWQSLFDTAVDEIELRVLRALAEAGVPLPEQGHETGTGVTIDIAWPNHRVAVVFSPVQGHELAGEGWTVAGLWDDDLPARVKTLLGTDTTGGG